ncbi:MAG: alpha/beta hydrolase fold domain-containing protein, partial [Erysipelothrix sp.]
TLGINNTEIFVGGNSAGAQISAQLGSMITNKSDYEHEFKSLETIMPEQLKGLVLLNGVFNFDNVGDAGFPGFDMFAWSYTGTKKYQDFERIDELSAYKHVNQDFPQSFITVGDADPLRYQSYDMESKLNENNVPVTTVYWTGSNYELNHDYFFDLTQESSKVMFERMIEFLNTHR